MLEYEQFEAGVLEILNDVKSVMDYEDEPYTPFLAKLLRFLKHDMQKTFMETLKGNEKFSDIYDVFQDIDESELGCFYDDAENDGNTFFVATLTALSPDFMCDAHGDKEQSMMAAWLLGYTSLENLKEYIVSAYMADSIRQRTFVKTSENATTEQKILYVLATMSKGEGLEGLLGGLLNEK